MITADELWGGSTPAPCAPGTPVLTQDIVAMVVSTGASARVSHDIAPRFEGRRPGSGKKHQPNHPHPPAALRARENRPY